MNVLRKFINKDSQLFFGLVSIVSSVAIMSALMFPYRFFMGKANTSIEIAESNITSMSKLAYPAGLSYDLDFELLARFISSVAGKEPYICQVSVGAVIINRVQNEYFANNIASVIYSLYPSLPDDFFEKMPSERAQNAARDALLGIDPSGDALFFFKKNDESSLVKHKNDITATFGNYSFSK